MCEFCCLLSIDIFVFHWSPKKKNHFLHYRRCYDTQKCIWQLKKVGKHLHTSHEIATVFSASVPCTVKNDKVSKITEWVMLTRARQWQSEPFLLFWQLGTTDWPEKAEECPEFPTWRVCTRTNIRKRRQKRAPRKRPCSRSARRHRCWFSSICAAHRVWLPSPWQRRADCLAFSMTPLIKRCAVITARGEEYIWARSDVYLKWLLSFERFEWISWQKLDTEENRMLVFHK